MMSYFFFGNRHSLTEKVVKKLKNFEVTLKSREKIEKEK